MKTVTAATLLFVLTLLAGCAHPFVITPPLDSIAATPGAHRIDKTVGFYVAPELRTAAVVTPGGGGDKVRYTPYKDTEAALYKMLNNVFTNVTILQTDDAAANAKAGLSFVITPTLVTNSASSSAFTWPPTDFTMDLTCTVRDAAGQIVLSARVSGDGKTEFSEFKHDFAQAGERAVTDAVLKMQQALLSAAELRR